MSGPADASGGRDVVNKDASTDAAPGDHAPGDRAPGSDEEKTSGSLLSYSVGFAFALMLTTTSFLVSQTHLLWAPGLAVGLAVLAIAQMGVHLVFFFHLSTGADNTNNVLALAFGVLIVALVVSGSLWIMANLDDSMMPASTLQEMQR